MGIGICFVKVNIAHISIAVAVIFLALQVACAVNGG